MQPDDGVGTRGASPNADHELTGCAHPHMPDYVRAARLVLDRSNKQRGHDSCSTCRVAYDFGGFTSASIGGNDCSTGAGRCCIDSRAGSCSGRDNAGPADRSARERASRSASLCRACDHGTVTTKISSAWLSHSNDWKFWTNRPQSGRLRFMSQRTKDTVGAILALLVFITRFFG